MSSPKDVFANSVPANKSASVSTTASGKNRVVVLGATGSIGTSTLDVIAAHPDSLELFGVTAHRRWHELAAACARFEVPHAVLSDPDLSESICASEFPESTQLSFGRFGLEELAGHPDVDTVIAGIVGAAGLQGTRVAVESGKRVGIANKETLVVAGPLIMATAKRTGAVLLPVDSEHSAIFQAMQAGRSSEVKQVTLTASGGPFREWPSTKLKGVTPEQALAHPTWDMGPKISVDSATMMNKALEIIEARWLFDLPAEKIAVVVHPQSIVHSMVEFQDGSVIAQLSPPDMKLPIQYALSWPNRWTGSGPAMDWSQTLQLDFFPPDLERFPALELGFETARRGGTCGAVLNAANEIAVERFLSGTLQFTDIARACRAILDNHTFDASPDYDALAAADERARKEMLRWKC